jgi:hypothetical protein
MKEIFIFIILFNSFQIIAQPYPNTFSTGNTLDEQLINNYLSKPFGKSILSFKKIDNVYFYFDILTSLHKPVTSNVKYHERLLFWIITFDSLYIEVYIENVLDDSKNIKYNYQVNVIEYTENYTLDPIIFIGMTEEELRTILGPWNYEYYDILVYYIGSHAIECTLDSEGKICRVLIYSYGFYL